MTAGNENIQIFALGKFHRDIHGAGDDCNLLITDSGATDEMLAPFEKVHLEITRV